MANLYSTSTRENRHRRSDIVMNTTLQKPEFFLKDILIMTSVKLLSNNALKRIFNKSAMKYVYCNFT